MALPDELIRRILSFADDRAVACFATASRACRAASQCEALDRYQQCLANRLLRLERWLRRVGKLYAQSRQVPGVSDGVHDAYDDILDMWKDCPDEGATVLFWCRNEQEWTWPLFDHTHWHMSSTGTPLENGPAMEVELFDAQRHIRVYFYVLPEGLALDAILLGTPDGHVVATAREPTVRKFRWKIGVASQSMVTDFTRQESCLADVLFWRKVFAKMNRVCVLRE